MNQRNGTRLQATPEVPWYNFFNKFLKANGILLNVSQNTNLPATMCVETNDFQIIQGQQWVGQEEAMALFG